MTKYHIDHDKEERECGYCRKVKPFEDFHFTYHGTPMSYCKACNKIKSRKFYQKVKSKICPNSGVNLASVDIE